MLLFLELCSCRGCAKQQRWSEAADPWPPSSECYSRKQHISHSQCGAFPPDTHRDPESTKDISYRNRHRPSQSVKFSTVVFYISCIWWQVRCCPVPTLTHPVYGKHSLTGQPLTHCLDLYSVSMAAVPQTQLLSFPLLVFPLFDRGAEQYPEISNQTSENNVLLFL